MSKTDYLDLTLRIVPIIISVIALLVSVLSNRKTLDVTISDNCIVVDGGHISIIETEERVHPYGPCLVTQIEIVNPSSKDIAFFDLRAFNPTTNINYDLLTKNTVLHNFIDKPIYRVIFNQGMERLLKLNPPDANYGVLKANSFTRMDIVIFPDKKSKEVSLSFKVAMRAKIRDPFAITSRKKFKFHGKNYDVNGWYSLRKNNSKSNASNIENT